MLGFVHPAERDIVFWEPCIWLHAFETIFCLAEMWENPTVASNKGGSLDSFFVDPKRDCQFLLSGHTCLSSDLEFLPMFLL